MDSDEQPGTRLRENLIRMFEERGSDFFDQDDEQRQANKPTGDPVVTLQSKDTTNQSSDGQNTESTSPEALSKMKPEILPQLQYVWQVSRFLPHH